MPSIVFLLDVDNTLLDNDSVKANLDQHLQADPRVRHWRQDAAYICLGSLSWGIATLHPLRELYYAEVHKEAARFHLQAECYHVHALRTSV